RANGRMFVREAPSRERAEDSGEGRMANQVVQRVTKDFLSPSVRFVYIERDDFKTDFLAVIALTPLALSGLRSGGSCLKHRPDCHTSRIDDETMREKEGQDFPESMSRSARHGCCVHFATPCSSRAWGTR